MCFYDAERVLSAIANILLLFLGEVEGLCKMGGSSGSRREWGGKGKHGGAGMHEKIDPKRNI